MPPRKQIEEAERRLYDLAEKGRYDGGFQSFAERCAAPSTWRRGLSARRQPLRHLDRPARSRPRDGRPAALRPDHPRRPPGHGQDLARHQHRLQHRQGLARRAPAGRRASRPSTAASSASSRSKCRPSSSRPVSSPSSPASPSYKIRRGDITEAEFARLADVAGADRDDPALYRPDRRHLDRAARRPRPAAQAPEGPRCPRHRLPPAALGLVQERARTACRS